MTGKQSFNTKLKNSKWTKEDRGAGHGEDDFSWTTIHDFASRGRPHHVFGHTCYEHIIYY
jgi:hypothetical protein